MTTRYKERLYTPGGQSPGKSIAGFNQKVADEYNQIQSRRSELAAELAAVKDEISQIKTNLGAWVAEGLDYKEYTDRLTELRSEQEGLQDAIDHLTNEAARLKRVNSWIK